VRQGQRKLGEEVFQLFELPERQGYQLHSSLVLQWPLPHTERVTLELDPSWRYRSARLELEAERHLTLAQYQVDNSRLRGRIEAVGRRPVESSLSCSLLDYPSALFVFALCKKIVLAPGDSSDIDLVHIELPSLEPKQFHCTCARLFDHHATFEIGTFSVKEFVLQASSEELLHTWIDEAGVPLRIHRTEQGELICFDLVRYRLFR
jgi:hypothetical protein